MKKTNKYLLAFAFLCGLGSMLFVPTPFGRIAMFDLAAFFLGPLLFYINFPKFTRAEHKVLLWALLWLFGAVFSNWWRQEYFDVALKGNAIVFNVWCMLVVGIWLLKEDYRTWMWFVVGNGLSCVISLYYFQNGSLLVFAEKAGFIGHGGLQDYLQEKQVYPLYFKAIIYSVLFPLVALHGLPWIVVIVVLIFSAFFMLIHGGSRSTFGVNLMGSVFFIGYAYFKRLARLFIRNFTILCIAGAIVGAFTFSIYKNLALQGKLGEDEYNKYYAEMVDSESGVLGSRDDIVRAWPFLRRHPIVGSGSSYRDRWGYTDDDRLPGHSALVGAWVQNGIFGLLFWCYVLYLIMHFVQKKVMRLQSLAPFAVLKAISMGWAILFSPFGGYRGEVSLMIALCVVAEDEKWLRQVSTMLASPKRVRKNGKSPASTP
ncbi:MAG: O-antigen ligase family protein [Kiritimatiellia bacterium]|jgi:hypothetical protein